MKYSKKSKELLKKLGVMENSPEPPDETHQTDEQPTTQANVEPEITQATSTLELVEAKINSPDVSPTVLPGDSPENPPSEDKGFSITFTDYPLGELDKLIAAMAEVSTSLPSDETIPETKGNWDEEKAHLNELKQSRKAALKEQAAHPGNMEITAEIRSYDREIAKYEKRIPGYVDDTSISDQDVKPEKDISSDPLLIQMKQAVLDADQIQIMDFPEQRKILSPWLSEQSIILVSGWRGVGKTLFAEGVCDSITRGFNFGPWETITPVPILYIDGEMVIQDIKKRLVAMAKGVSEKRKEPFLIYSDFLNNAQGIPKTNLLDPSCRDRIKAMALSWSVKLLVLDNLSSLCPGIDENSKKEWDPINQWLLELRFSGVTTMMLHHVGKQGGQRGTSAREDSTNISIILSYPPKYVSEDRCRFILNFDKNRSGVSASEAHLVSETEFRLLEKEDGQAVWTFSSVKKINKLEVLRMISEGVVHQTEIVTATHLTPGRVSQLRGDLIKEGYLSKKGEITGKGEELLEANY